MSIKLKKQISQNISVAVWQIAETEEFFYDSLQLLPEDEIRIKNCKLQKVRLQKLACRATLAELLKNNKIGITYSETGQPQLKNYSISFSHTTNTVAVALAKTSVGIDIEVVFPRIRPLYTRFMSEKEITDCDIEDLKDLYYYWCAKEAMYKWYSKKNIDFIKDLYVDKKEKRAILYNHIIVPLFDFYIDNRLIVVCCG